MEDRSLAVINTSIASADEFVNNNYLVNFSNNDIVPLDESEKNTSNIRLLKIKRIVYNNKENINDKLISVYGALEDIDSSMIMVIDSNQNGIDFYVGTKS